MILSRRSFLKLSASIAAAAHLKPAQLFASSEAENTILKAVKRIKADQNIALKILHPQGSLENIKPIANKFTQKTGIIIEFIKTPVNNINTKIFIDNASNKNTFDLAVPATFAIPDLAESDALSDLTNYTKKYEEKAGYTPSLYELGNSFNGKFYGYQTDGDAYMMFYKKSTLQNEDAQKQYEDQHGAVLKTPKTWSDVDKVMAFFHKPDQDQYGGCLFRTPEYTTWEWWSRFYENNIRPFTKDMRPNILNDHGVGALEDLIKATEHQHTSSKINSLFQNWEHYAQGKTIVNIGWGGTQKYLNQEHTKIYKDLIHTPTPDGGLFNWGWNYVVSKTCEHKEIAYLFSLYATMPNTSNIGIYAQDGFFDPYRHSHYNDPNIEDTYGKDFLAQHKNAMAAATPDLYISARQDYIRTLNENIILACRGIITAEEAMKLTSHNWEEITEQKGRKNQREQWQRLSEKYPERFNKT